jgi:hypothetical protein
MTGFLALTLALTLSAAGCDSGDTVTTPTPTPTPERVTETFSGTLTINGAVTFNFNSAGAGIVTATLKSLSPAGPNVGVALGTWNGVICQVVLANDNTAVGTTVTGSVTGTGNLCVRVYDVGQLTQAVGFEVVVAHP